MSREYRALLTKAFAEADELEEKARGLMPRGGSTRMWGRAVGAMHAAGRSTRTSYRIEGSRGRGVIYSMKPKKGKGRALGRASKLEGYLLQRYAGGAHPRGFQRRQGGYR